jgi:hydroxymethylbilane synthase
MTNTLRIGTRGSKLALVQAETVKQMLHEALPHIDTEIVIIKTSGDVKLDEPMAGRLDKGFFTREIEEALYSNQIDLAVHSLKDLPVDLPVGLTVGALLPRANPQDVLISRDGRTLEQLNPGDVVATSSLRRKSQLLRYHSDLKIIDIRGNVDTRLRKLKDGYCDAIILAAAGIERLGMKEKITQYIPQNIMISAPAQAVIGIEIRSDDQKTQTAVAHIHHQPTEMAVTAERLFLKEMGGGCHLPLGCFCENSDGIIHLEAFVSTIDGSQMLHRTALFEENKLEPSIRALAAEMLAAGGKEILDEVMGKLRN